MYDRLLLLELFLEIEEAIRRIERRLTRIQAPADCPRSDEGFECLDGISMMLRV